MAALFLQQRNSLRTEIDLNEMENYMKIKNATMAVCLSLCATSALADVAVFASHNIVSAVEDAAGTQVTIDVTVRNDGEALDGVVLKSIESYFLSGASSDISIGSIAAGESRTVRWTVPSEFPVDFFDHQPVLAFHAFGATAAGGTEFSVLSNEGVQ